MSFIFLFFACNEADKSADTADSTEQVMIDPVCEDPVDVECVDQLILDLSLHGDKVSDGMVSTQPDGDDFVSVIDASAGGFMDAVNNPWVYVKFHSINRGYMIPMHTAMSQRTKVLTTRTRNPLRARASDLSDSSSCFHAPAAFHCCTLPKAAHSACLGLNREP